MKGFIACALRLAKIASQSALRLPLQLSLSYDEEVGCVGVRSLIADMATWGCRPQFCIVGEPTLLTTAIGHKGKTALAATCHGRAAHSGYPSLGINAIHMAAEFVTRLKTRQSLLESAGARDTDYQVPHSTLHVGVIRGGTALNIVPARCELELEIRNLPAEDPSIILDGVRADADFAAGVASDPSAARIDIDVLNTYPGLDTPSDSSVVQLLAVATGNRACVKVGFGTEGGLFSSLLGIPTAICGPGSIDQAHRPDEFVTLDQLNRCDAMMDGLLNRLMSG
jgi:acetylornithine deacetylase